MGIPGNNGVDFVLLTDVIFIHKINCFRHILIFQNVNNQEKAYLSHLSISIFQNVSETPKME